MIIKNKKNGLEYNINHDEWLKLVKQGENNKFQVISQKDYKDEVKIEKPIEVISFIKKETIKPKKQIKTKK